jgi:lipoprotein-anchoring transpeptidase ErfK/SrfK
MRRGAVLAILMVGSLVVGCGAADPPGRSGSLTAPATFVVPGPDPVPLTTGLPTRGHVVVAAVGRRFHVFDAPISIHQPRSLRATNDWGQQLWLPVIERRVIRGDGWFHVLVPERPNGSTGWLPAGEVSTSTVEERVVVRLGAHELILYEGQGPARRYEVAIGKPSTPTTPGRFFVWARVGYQDVRGPYGNFALGLSGFSEVITDWPGGGRMAIHGTSDPSLAGHDVSNGCIRVYNPLMTRLIGAPMGTTVIIRP